MKHIAITLSYSNLMKSVKEKACSKPTWVADTATIRMLDLNGKETDVVILVAVYDIPKDAVR